MSHITKEKKRAICNEGFDDDVNAVHVRQKGADGINIASAQRGDNICIDVGSKVHADPCRKKSMS